MEIAFIGGILVILGTLLGEAIPVMSIWYLNNGGSNYTAYITLLGYSISQGDTILVDSQSEFFSLLSILAIAAGGVILIAGTFGRFHKGIFVGWLVSFVSLFILGTFIPVILENLFSLPNGIARTMSDSTLSPAFTFGANTPTGFIAQFLGGGFWLAGFGAVLGFLAWYRLSSNTNPEDQEVLELEKQVDHTVRHMQIKRAEEAAMQGETKAVQSPEAENKDKGD